MLATGSHPSKPPIPGIEGANILTSDDVLALNACPEKIVIVGGGVIGLEFATLFASLGKEVVILEMLDRLLPALDEDVAAVFLRSLRDMKVDVHTASSVVSLQGGNPVVCTFREGGKEKTVCGDICIVCTGREPATTDMGLENTAVRLTHRGFVEVNDCMQTNEPNIYAIGDITGKIQLAHVATAQGMVAAANLAQRTAVMRYDIVPACIYAMPEIAYVGMNSHQSEAAGYRPVAGTFPLAACGRALTMDAPSGIIRLIFDDVSKRLLGAQLISPHATDMIGEICVALKKRLRMDELSDIIHPHPTLCECILEATHAVEGLCCNIAKIS